jgi:hypothetical protein
MYYLLFVYIIAEVFVEGVEWCLVVTTIECVYLSALYRAGGTNHANSGNILFFVGLSIARG